MAKKSNNKKQQSKQQGAAPKAKGAKGAVTSKGRSSRGSSGSNAQSAVLRDAVDAARESAEVLREAATVLSQSAAQSAAQTVAQARWNQFAGQSMGFPALDPASLQAAAAFRSDALASGVASAGVAGTAGTGVPAQPLTGASAINPSGAAPMAAGTAGAAGASVAPQVGVSPVSTDAAAAPVAPAPASVATSAASSANAVPAAVPQAQAAAPAPQAQAQAQAQPQPAPASVQPQQLQQVQQLQSFAQAPMPSQSGSFAAVPGMPMQSGPIGYGDALQPVAGDQLTRVSHNASMGEQVGFTPKEPEQKRRWGSPIKSLKSAVAALTNSDRDAEPEPAPEAPLPRTQIDYTPKPELLNDLPKFGEAPMVLPTPQELLASVPLISTTGQIIPTDGGSPYAQPALPEYGYAGHMMPELGHPDQLAVPPLYSDTQPFSVEFLSDQIPPIQEQVIEVPAQEVVYGEVQMPDPYLQAYDSMNVYDPAHMYDPNQMQPYDPVQMQGYDPAHMQMRGYDPAHLSPQGYDSAQAQPYDPNQMQPYDPYTQQFGQQSYGQASYGADQPYDPSMYGHGFDQGSAYDPYGYGADPYDPYADPAGYAPLVPVKGGKATVSLILGILSILLAFIPPLGLVLAIVAILLAKSYHKKGGMAPRAGTGRVCGLVGIILSLLLAVAIGVFLAYFYGGLYGESNAGAIMGYLQTTPLKNFL